MLAAARFESTNTMCDQWAVCSLLAPSRRQRVKTGDLNPVIISNSLNSTLNRLADVMEKSLDTAVTTATTSSATSAPIVPSSTTSSFVAFSSVASSSVTSLSFLVESQILDQAIRITAELNFLTEDELLAASIFFTSASEDAVRAARTFIVLSNNYTVQCRFLLCQLVAAGFLPNKDGDDHSMVY